MNRSTSLAGGLLATPVVTRSGFTISDALAIFVIGVVIIVATVAIMATRRGRPWGVAWGLGPPRRNDIQAAAAADVAVMQEESELFFREDAPGHQEDDL